MKITNTLTSRKEDFSINRHKTLGMFVCGPTVYDLSHIGHAKTYIFFDVVAKYLRSTGVKILYLQNITDIDDRIINRAKEQDKDPKEISEEFYKAYREDMKSLGISSVDQYAKATAHISEIKDQVSALLEKGYAYSVPAIKAEGESAVASEKNNDVYFDVSKFQEYGKLSKQDLSQLESGVRVAVESNKRNARDFLLWKAQNYSYEPAWKSPWGMGRPGWHIEDTAISEKYLGQQYDIHGGGIDLVFPHHECEIAQQEAASGKRPFVRYWLHTGHLTVNGEKMSKSLGNFITVRDMLAKYSKESIRMMALSSYYRTPYDYREKNMKQFEAAVGRISEFVEKLKKAKGHGNRQVYDILGRAHTKFDKAMDDDFNTPLAIGSFFETIRYLNPFLADNSLSGEEAAQALSFVKKVDDVLGIVPKKTVKVPKEVTQLIDQREKEREEKNWEAADTLRKQIEDLGYTVDDTSYGPYVKKKS